MGVLLDNLKQIMELNKTSNDVDFFKKNSLYFYEKYNKSDNLVTNIPNSKIVPGGFYFLHYKNESNWLRYSPVFVCDFKKFSNKNILLAVNFNLIPLDIRAMVFDKFITKKDLEEDRYLSVDFQGMYQELLKIGFEYSIMEYDLKLMVASHKINMSELSRFLYHQHPINKYDPYNLIKIWKTKIENREKRHKELIETSLNDFYNTNIDISEKFDSLKKHVQRIQRNNRKYG